MLDSSIREVLQPDCDLVLLVLAKRSSQSQMIAKIEGSAKRLVAAPIYGRQYVGAYADFGKP